MPAIRTDASLNRGGWKKFSDPGHLASLGYTPAPADPVWNPDGLPIGFAKSRTPDGEFMGPTCAACHTNKMVLGGPRYWWRAHRPWLTGRV